MHSPNLGFQSKFASLALALVPVTLWLLTHGYHGISEDGQIYAFQAYARLHPQLATDLYLQNTSQDQFTLFSPVYAWFIALLGLESASRLLTVVFTAWLLLAGWSFTRVVAGREAAWLGVAFLLIVTGDYGAYGVFRIFDPFLTARLPAEALSISALACYLRGRKQLGLLLTLLAMLVHPLIALPGLLLLICLWAPIRSSAVGAIGCVLGTLALAISAVFVPWDSSLSTVMDPQWTNLVKERSQFLFLQLWSLRDWDINIRPFIYLGFTAIAAADDRVHKLCAAAVIVGSVGLAMAFIGSRIGPVALLVQGQAWRWVWVGVFISAALLPYLVMRVWRDDKFGPPGALLLVLGWIVPAIFGTVCAWIALIFWLCRTHLNASLAARMRWACAAICVTILVWILFEFCASLPAAWSNRAPSGALQPQDTLALRFLAALLGALAWWMIRWKFTGSRWVPMIISMVLAAISFLALPSAFRQARTLADSAAQQEFADWERAIPPTSTVLVVPARDAGAFVWFSLRRPNYLAMNQSAGVVFSRATASEVRRRSEVLLPLMDPDWEILTRLQAKSSGERRNEITKRPLTPEILTRVCADPQLGFILSQENVGFAPLRHEHSGTWKDWNLYDCRKVRSVRSVT